MELAFRSVRASLSTSGSNRRCIELLGPGDVVRSPRQAKLADADSDVVLHKDASLRSAAASLNARSNGYAGNC